MKRPSVDHKNVLVTGCSSGIGRATADLLRAQSWEVVPTARTEEDLDILRNDGYTPVRLDLANEASVKAAAEQALELFDGRLGGLVNNAGFALAGAMEDVGRDALRHQMEVNFIGVQDLTNRLVPVLRSQGWGRIVNVSSVFGRIVGPLVGSYSASKFALEAATDALRIELWSTGVGVSLIEPGPIITEFRSNAAAVAAQHLDTEQSRFGDTYDRKITRKKRQISKPDFFRKPPSAVAIKIRHALESEHPRRRYGVTPAATLVAILRRFAPDALLDAALRRQVGS
jgi:NAD(P)-dependent dehydrogenase (short-subunit alcohol dehydrogenase family)